MIERFRTESVDKGEQSGLGIHRLQFRLNRSDALLYCISCCNFKGDTILVSEL